MARPKEFNRQEALDKAMELFWTRGYEATTMTDLRKAIGIGRQSLYDTFGDKQRIFAEALGQYVVSNDTDVTTTLLEGQQGIDDIRAFLEARVKMLSSGFRRGCLMINTIVEVAPHNDGVASQLHEGLTTMELGLETALNRAVQLGQISSEANVSELALFLTTQIAGMVVMSKNRASEQQLQAIVEQALRALQ